MAEKVKKKNWARQDSNLQPDGYEPPALTIELHAHSSCEANAAQVGSAMSWQIALFSESLTMGKVAAAARAIAALLALTCVARAEADGPGSKVPVLQVTGTGSVRAEPDMATIRIGVTTEDANAQEAVARNNSATQKITKELEAASIEKKDLKTSNFSVYPQYRTEGDTKRQVLTYRVSNTVTVTIRDIAKVGDILTKVVAAGSNQISGPNFSISDPEKYMNLARKKAVENAMTKASAYAGAAGLKLGALLEMIEPGAGPSAYAAHSAASVRSLSSVPVETGEESLQAQVVLVIELKQ